MRSGLWASMSPSRRLVPARMHRAWAAAGESRKVSASGRARWGAGEQVAHQQQAEVGVRGLGEPVEQEGEQLLHEPAGAVEAAGELPDRGLGPAGVDEPERARGGSPRPPGQRVAWSGEASAKASSSGRK